MLWLLTQATGTVATVCGLVDGPLDGGTHLKGEKQSGIASPEQRIGGLNDELLLPVPGVADGIEQHIGKENTPGGH